MWECVQEVCNNYRSEEDVYGVVTRQFLLQVLKLLYVLAAACLHQVLKAEHS